MGVGHGHAHAGGPQHGDVVEPVAKGHGLLHGDAQAPGQLGQGGIVRHRVLDAWDAAACQGGAALPYLAAAKL